MKPGTSLFAYDIKQAETVGNVLNAEYGFYYTVVILDSKFPDQTSTNF